MLTPLPGATFDVNPSTGYGFIRYGGLVHPVRLSAAEMGVFLALKVLLDEQRERSETAADSMRRNRVAKSATAGTD